MLSLSRDTRKLARDRFELLVIGGGIHGAAAAWDAATRGIKTALVEKGDFGGATSAGCFKIVHGGLRYLQHLDLPRIAQSAREQRLLRVLAPHLVHPLPFLIPCYGRGMRSAPVLNAGLTVYDLLTLARNSGVSPSHTLPWHRMVDRAECLNIAPYLPAAGLRGGLIYYDCQMENCERLTFSVAASAARAGATVANYVEVIGASTAARDGKVRIDSVQVRDLLGGVKLEISADVVLVAAGPWSARVAGLISGTGSAAPVPQLFSKGIQLVMPQYVSKYAVALESGYIDPEARLARGGRSFFLQPWRGHTLVGTSDTIFEGSPDAFQITRQEAHELLEDVRAAYPDPRLHAQDIRFTFGGLRPISRQWLQTKRSGKDSGEAKAARNDILVDHSTSAPAVANLVSIEGVKYTTFRAVAERVINLVCSKLSRAPLACRTAGEVLYGGDIGDPARYLADVSRRRPEWPSAQARHLVSNYGSLLPAIEALADERRGLEAPLAAGTPVLAAEIVHVVRHEMAHTLADVVLRRTALGTLGCPGDPALERAAALAGAELGWSAERRREEVRSCKELFSSSAGPEIQGRASSSTAS